MPIEYIWTVSASGVPCRIPAISDPKCTSEIEWQEVPCADQSSIRTIAASSTTAFAIDKSGRVLVLVLPSHIAIRERVDIYANQRWFFVKWIGTLSIDRPRFSDETGRIAKDPSFDEISAGWSWEEPWATHLDHRLFDNEGWQYSMWFMTGKWENKCGRLHQVRRKMLKRHMRYTAHDQWVEMDNEEGRMFVELTFGGSEVVTEGLLFALGDDGNVYRRDGIKANRPSGSHWELMPKIKMKNFEVDDVTLISMSPSMATLLCITWDGRIYCRQGISSKSPSGITWQSVATPKDKAVICASIGTNSMWCITADGCVWFTRVQVDEKRKEHVMESISANGYQLVTQGGVSRVSVSKNDQVFCISSREKIEVRTGVDDREPSGRRFESIVDRGEPKDQRWISINTGAIGLSKIPEYFLSSTVLQSKMEVLQFKRADWRLSILERLQESSDNSWALMNSVKGDEQAIEDDKENNEEEKNVKRIRCQMKSGDTFKSVTVAITETHLEISGDGKTQKKMEKRDIKSVIPAFQRLPQKYLLYVFTGDVSENECFAFTDEKSRCTFQTVVETIIRDHICFSTRSSFGECMWSVSLNGVVRWHCFAEMSSESGFERRVNPGASRSLTVEGHFEAIDCGVNRSVWAVNQTGSLYSLSSHFDPLNSHECQHDYTVTDEVTLRMTEYQKHAIFRGFITFQGSQKGISSWMCDGQPCPPSFSSLRSSNWHWIDSTWKLEDEQWEYSNEIDGVYTPNEKEQGKARRRFWTRRAKFESKKSPWSHVEGPAVQCVRVGKRESEDGTTTVVVLTKDGHILRRNGVTRENFTGTNWSQILTDNPISSIYLQWEDDTLWCIASNGLIMSKKLSCTSDWKHVEMDLTPLTKLFSPGNFGLTGYSGVLYVRFNSILYRIDTINQTISDPYPMDNLQEAVVNAHGSICVRGANITVIREWRVFPYPDRKATIIAMQKVERATNLGKWLKSFAVF